MADLFSYGVVVILSIFLVSAVRRSGELVAEGGWGWVRAETVDRDDQQANKRILNSIEEKERRIRNAEERIREKDERITNVLNEKEQLQGRLSDFERITRSLKSESIARDRLIERYWKPLHAVIICFTEQKIEGDKETWLRSILEEKYSLHKLTGFTYIIPPAEVPTELKKKRNSREELRRWVEEELYSSHPEATSTICFVGVFDLRNVYSRSDHDQKDRSHFFSTIDEQLNLEDIFNADDFSKLLASNGVNLSKVIEKGDIPFLASKAITPDELDQIHNHQEQIEDSLGNPTLRKIANELRSTEIAEAVDPFVSDSSSVATSIKEEATIWERELYK